MTHENVELQKKADSLYTKTLYIPRHNVSNKSVIFQTKKVKAFVYVNNVVVKIQNFTSKLDYFQTFTLNKSIFETKEEALDNLINFKKEKLKNLAIQFKKEKKELDEILNDVESVFYSLPEFDDMSLIK